jgi:Flp pilus assembly protein TadD
MNLPPEFGETLRRAMDASAAGQSDTAIELFRQAMQEQPGFAVPPFLLGAEFAQLGRNEEAQQAYASAVLMAPELHIARFQLGLLQFTSGQAALALMTWQPLLALPEDQALRAFVMGFTAMAGDAFDDAIAHFRTGQQLNHDNPPLNNDIDMVIERIQAVVASQAAEPGQPQPAEAVEPPAEEETDSNASHVLLSNYRGGSYH